MGVGLLLLARGRYTWERVVEKIAQVLLSSPPRFAGPRVGAHQQERHKPRFAGPQGGVHQQERHREKSFYGKTENLSRRGN